MLLPAVFISLLNIFFFVNSLIFLYNHYLCKKNLKRIKT